VDRASPSPSSSANSLALFENFDYLSHWYPVVWARDLLLNEPTKITIFDVDYVVAKISETEVISLEDACPHKAAALSQGRVTASGAFQCAYHGWSFNGKSGDCLEIPQLVKKDGSMQTISSRSRATAVPAQISQGMVWLFPGGNLEQALSSPPPPTIPELNEGFQMVQTTRDMPVDFPIVVSNICDPDHGLFAHQAKNFDMYSASQDKPLKIEEEFPNNGKGWILKSFVDSGQKVLEVDRTLRGERKKKDKQEAATLPIATSILYAPNHLQLKRVDKESGQTKFVSGFWICPVGVGRTRFMSAAISKFRPPPRWLTSPVFLDNFLDQDTYLLSTQEHNILPKEAEELRNMIQNASDEGISIEKLPMKTRKKLFCLQSPTEKVGAKIENFWDATLTRVPNRVTNLLKLDSAGTFLKAAERSVILKREDQHLKNVPESQDVVRNCQRVIKVSKAISTVVVATKLYMSLLANNSSPKSAFVGRLNVILRPSLVATILGLSTVASYLARKLKREYYYKYTDDMRRKDLSSIPKTVWLDK
jgi:phenylpropionate dioxygenase-like ring-hydroxylating dioxygenase large terminal subunit/uncharacterized protein YaaQ